MAKNEVVETDVLIIGGGVAGLAFAIRLADLAAAEGQSPKILLLEKGASLGSHNLSGAVVDPSTLKVLLPDVAEKDLPFESPVLSGRSPG